MHFFKVLACVISTCLMMASAWSTKPVHIAITKITAHPSLDLIEQGILDVLKKHHPDAKITLNNAQGNITLASQIAQKFSALTPTAVVPITTPSAQTLLKAFRRTKTPIVFAAVTDPIGANLLTGLSASTHQITGVIDQPPVKQTVRLMLRINPDLKTIGIIYNAGEANSLFQIEAFRKEAEQNGLSVRGVPVAKTSDIQMAMASLSQTVDAIFLPNDNLIISSIKSILKIANNTSLPIYVSDPESIKQGAFAALAFDQYDIGTATGNLLIKVLASGSAKTHPPLLLSNPKLYINETIASKLKISPDLIETLKKDYNNKKSTLPPSIKPLNGES